MVVLAAVTVFALFALLARGRSRLYRYGGGVALAGHVLFAVAALPVLPYSWDIDVFHGIALRILAGGDISPFSSLGAFGAVQAALYVVFGRDPAVLSVFNGLLAVLMPLPACYLAARLYDTESTDSVLLAVLFLPFPFLFHSLPMRDALATLLALTTLAVCVRVVVDRQYPWAATLPPLWTWVLLLREELAILILLGTVGAVLVGFLVRGTSREVTLPALTLATVPVGLAGFAVFASLFPIDALNDRLQYRADGGAAYLEFMTYESWLDVALAAPVRAIYFQFAPFPLHVNSAFDLVAALFSPVLVVLAIAAYRSLRSADTDPRVVTLLLVVYAGGVVGYGLVDSNFGTTIRHRSSLVFLLVVFSTPVLEPRLQSLRRWTEGPPDQRRDGDKEQCEAQERGAGPEM